ncbi:MAG: hypothetical protein ACRDM8_08210 [Gaiellaceae bacterium]
MTITHGEAAVQAKLHEMVQAKLAMIRVRLEEMTHSTSPGRAAEARRLLDRLNAEHGPDPQHSQS